MKRRVLLGGIGTASIGIGATFGSGAFTSIEANRDVELNVESDSSAQIIFEARDGTGADRLLTTDETNAVNVIKFSQTNLNEQSKTTFKKALKIENNTDASDSGSADQSGLTVDLYVQQPDDGGIGDGDGDVLDFRVDDGDDTRSIVQDDSDNKNAATLEPTDNNGDEDTAKIDIVIDLLSDDVTTGDQDDNDLESIGQVTFVVEANE
jgi:hypothetical protein